ncbi:hypothetical protein GQ53DRAFT_836344 [Thozetella sp. PMI_491]|nr:hypothetical protein GQ53DRAFT_836344 [Thozetella sp. PMI_491]
MAAQAPGSLAGAAKLEAVTSLLTKLRDDLKSISLLPHQRDAALEELKLYGRDPTNADPIFTREGIETLTRHAFNSPSNATCRHALRVLCNALFLRKETRQMFVDLGYESRACNKLKNDNRDDEFLVSRLIFLTTYDTDIDLDALIDKHHLADIITQNLARHVRELSAGESKTKRDPMADMALSETAKLLFNITHHRPKKVQAFTPTIPHIVTLLCKHEVPAVNAPLTPPFGQLVNTLLNLDLSSKDAKPSIYPKGEPSGITDRLIQLLDLSMKSYSDAELEQMVSSLVGVINKIHEYAPDNVRQYIRNKLLPTETDRQDVLGRGSALSSRLLRNSTNAGKPELREAISSLIFDMSDKDGSKFVENVGYGFASGFLFQNNMPIPKNATEAYSSQTGEGRRAVNLITGQFLDAEKLLDAPKMTEEEKEREAERLFVLFERLKKNGIISVQNPVEQEFREGRVEELDRDDTLAEELD